VAGVRGDSDYAAFVEAMDEARLAARARPEPMDVDELARVVSDQARAGSVQAMKLRWEMLTHEDEPDTHPQIWTLRDGKVVRMRVFADREEALRAVGLA
jgi:ketosteroid isomerase-like protein